MYELVHFFESTELNSAGWSRSNQLVLNLEYGLFSATENHFCCAASYLELEPLSCRYKGLAVVAPAMEFNAVELKTKRTVNAMKM
ncbi:hypothetical protein OIU79_022384 [Salix purpurea]|uniref:Uncharacterized protein n=1 Tax=Salix purpurea TaxID=77065 RepID=A0A9Q0WFQ2_SALPP|nr:hypothetical protein OIU79_022384 [Salix purpurea]